MYLIVKKQPGLLNVCIFPLLLPKLAGILTNLCERNITKARRGLEQPYMHIALFSSYRVYHNAYPLIHNLKLSAVIAFVRETSIRPERIWKATYAHCTF